jgi:hypothetical protein
MKIYKSQWFKFINHPYYWIMFINMFLFLVLAGGITNVLVVSTNDGRMPVLTNNWELNTSTHFSYSNPEEVRDPHLTDRYHLFNAYFSLGDVLMWVGGFMAIMLLFAHIASDTLIWWCKTHDKKTNRTKSNID